MPETDSDFDEPAAEYGARQKTGLVLGPLLAALAGLALHSQSLPLPATFAGAIVVLMATWWITEPIPLWATALLPLVLFPVFSVSSLGSVVLQYLDPINMLFLGGMWIAASMEQWNLHRRIALGIVAKVGTGPRRIVLGFMLATAFISLWISNTAAALMMFPIAMAVLSKFREETGPRDPLLRRFGLALMLGIAYAASVGGIGTKIGTGTNLVFVKNAKSVLAQEIDFVTWAKIGMPVVIVALPLVWLYLVRIAAPLPVDGFPGGQKAVAEERARLGRLSRGEWIALIAFVAAALLWIFRKDIDLGAFTIPGWSRIVPFSLAGLSRSDPAGSGALDRWLKQDFGDAAVAMIVGSLLLVMPAQSAPLRFALDFRRAGRISWGLLVLLGGGFAMAHGIQQSKLSGWIAEIMSGIGSPSLFVAILAICVISTVLTEVASNTATASILLPLLATSADSMGLHPAPLMLAATLAASFGFMLPAGTPPNAIVFASGYITVPQMARSGILVDVMGIGIVTFVCYFIVPWILGIG